MSVAVIVPWRPGCPHRERAWAWVRDRYSRHHPDWQLVADPTHADPWIKAQAVMPAARASTADILVVADADVWCDSLPAAVEAVRSGAPWAIPHTLVHRLSQAATGRLLAGSDTSYEYDQPPYPGMAGGGIVALPRAVLLEVPIDPRFVGWGQEDESWAVALEATLGPPWRGSADLLHLWHPPQARVTRARGSREGWLLRRRYMKARHAPALLRALLEEARDALDAHQPAVHHPSPADGRREDPVRPAA